MKKYLPWIMWTALLPAYFISFFHRTSSSAVSVELSQLFSISGSVTGVLTAVFFYVYAAMQLPNGVLADSVGPRVLCAVGGTIMGAASIAFGLSNTFAQAVTARFFLGLGASFQFVSLMKIQTNWFDARHFPLLTGLTIFIGNCGALFGVGPFALLIKHISWQKVYVFLGISAFIVSIIAALIIRDAPAPMQRKKPASPLQSFTAIFRNRDNILTLIAFSCTNGVYMTIASLWGVPFLRHTYGLSAAAAGSVAVWLPLGVAAGCIANGPLAQLFKSVKRAGLILLFIGLLLWLAVGFWRPAVHFFIPLFFALGFCISGLNYIFTTVRNANPPEISATAIAFTNTGAFVMIALLQPLFGAVLDASAGTHCGAMPVYPDSGYRIVFVIVALLHALGIIFYYATSKRSEL